MASGSHRQEETTSAARWDRYESVAASTSERWNELCFEFFRRLSELNHGN